MDKFIETYGERPDGHGGLPTMATRAQDTWDALRAAYEIGKSEAPLRFTAMELVNGTPLVLDCLRKIHAAYDEEGNDLSEWPSRAADEIVRLLDRLTKDANAYWEAREHLINRIELLAKRNEALGSYRADEYEEAMQELDRHGIPRADGPGDNGLTLSLKGRMLRFLVRMTSNAALTERGD